MTDQSEAYRAFCALVQKALGVPTLSDAKRIEGMMDMAPPWTVEHLALLMHLALAYSQSPDARTRERAISLARAAAVYARVVGRTALLLAYILQALVGEEVGRERAESVISEGVHPDLAAWARAVLDGKGSA